MGVGEANIVEEVTKVAKKEAEQTCFICESRKAEFCVKGKPNACYCRHCAEEAYGDVSYLQKI